MEICIYKRKQSWTILHVLLFLLRRLTLFLFLLIRASCPKIKRWKSGSLLHWTSLQWSSLFLSKQKELHTKNTSRKEFRWPSKVIFSFIRFSPSRARWICRNQSAKREDMQAQSEKVTIQVKWMLPRRESLKQKWNRKHARAGRWSFFASILSLFLHASAGGIDFNISQHGFVFYGIGIKHFNNSLTSTAAARITRCSL